MSGLGNKTNLYGNEIENKYYSFHFEKMLYYDVFGYEVYL